MYDRKLENKLLYANNNYSRMHLVCVAYFYAEMIIVYCSSLSLYNKDDSFFDCWVALKRAVGAESD